MDVEKRGGGKELLQVRKTCLYFIVFAVLFEYTPHSLLCFFSFFFPASLLEAGKATFQSHTSHPGSQGGDEGQSLAWAQSYPAFPCCAQTCANPLVFLFFFVPDNWLWVTCFFGCTSLKKALTNLTVKKTKNLAQLPPSTRTLVFRSDIRRQVKLKCLVSE